MPAHRCVHRKQFPGCRIGHPHGQRILLEQETERGLTALKVGDIDPDPDTASVGRAPLLHPDPAVAGQILFVRVSWQCMASQAFGEPFILPTNRLRILPLRQTGPKDAFKWYPRSQGFPASSIEFSVLPIPEDQAIILIEQGEAFWNDVERLRQMVVRGPGGGFGLLGCRLRFRKSHLGSMPLRDVLVGRDPSLALHGAMPDAYDTSVRQLDSRI